MIASVEGVAWQREVRVGLDFSIISLLPSLYLPHGPCPSHHILIAALAVGLLMLTLGAEVATVGALKAQWGRVKRRGGQDARR